MAASGSGRRAVGFAWLAVAFAATAALAGWLALRDLDVPGLYYDEAIQAAPAAGFLRPGSRPLEIPGARSVRLLGGWLPVMTQPYMGALKSQILIPVFALFAPSPATLRTTTWLVGLLGLWLSLLWARRLLGPGVAIVAGALLLLDPSVLFVSRHDWGSFSLALLCRGGGLWLASAAWSRRSGAGLFASGLALGLGVYNKIDFAVFLAAAAAAGAVAAPRLLLRAAGPQRRLAACGLAGLLVGAAPMLASLAPALAAVRAAVRSRDVGAVGLGEKLAALGSVLDGSYFHRLMLTGGDFESVATVAGAAGGPFAWIFAAAAALLAARLARTRPWNPEDRARAFVLATALLTLAGILATPRAVRIHHFLNVVPFAHLVVAAAAVQLARSARRGVRGAAACAAGGAALAAVLVGSVRTDLAILDFVRETGGRGRWSNALAGFARELRAEAGLTVVSLDWGFHAPLRLLAPGLALEEPFWKLRRPSRPGVAWSLEGTTAHVYLLPEPRWAVFGLGGELIEALAGLPDDAYEIRIHRNRRGEPAFRSLRFARPHRLVYRDGFEVEWMAAIEIRGLDHVVLRVAELERSLRFYRDVLGCAVERRLDELGLVQLRAGGSLIDLVPVDSPLGRAGGGAPAERGRNVDHFALQLARFDAAAIRRHLEAFGVEPGEVAERYGALGMGPSMYLRDPDGNVVELKGAHPA